MSAAAQVLAGALYAVSFDMIGAWSIADTFLSFESHTII